MLQLWLMSQLQEDREDFIFQQSGALPHFHFDVLAHLSANLPGHWIGYTSDNDSPLLPWPPQSPNLTPWFFLMGLLQRSCVRASYATWFTAAATKDCGGSRCYRLWDVAMRMGGTWLQDWRLLCHQVDILSTCKVRQELRVSPSVDIPPIVTIPGSVPQSSEIPEELMNYPVESSIFLMIINSLHHQRWHTVFPLVDRVYQLTRQYLFLWNQCYETRIINMNTIIMFLNFIFIINQLTHKVIIYLLSHCRQCKAIKAVVISGVFTYRMRGASTEMWQRSWEKHFSQF
jgi:hypothetical protein